MDIGHKPLKQQWKTLAMFIIYRPEAEWFLEGLFSEETASDNVNNDLASVILDPEIFEGWLDEEHMDLEEDDENIDCMSERKEQVGLQGPCYEKPLRKCTWDMWGRRWWLETEWELRKCITSLKNNQ